MSLEEIKSFTGNIAEMGPIYPFIGWEWLFVILGVVFWIVWHVWQFKIEKDEFAKDNSIFDKKVSDIDQDKK